MDKKTKQILTIVICLFIFAFGLYYDYTTWSRVEHASLFQMFGLF